jgi:hypothetical protein
VAKGSATTGAKKAGGTARKTGAKKPAASKGVTKEVSVQTVQKKAPRRGIRLKIDDGTDGDDL